MNCCKVDWCIGLAVTDAPFAPCAVHAKYPQLEQLEPVTPPDEHCDCEGTGRCQNCGGFGEVDEPGEDDVIDDDVADGLKTVDLSCLACRGSGRCAECVGLPQACLLPRDESYLDWALQDGFAG